MIDAQRLIALADAATPGPYAVRKISWSKGGFRYHVEAGDGVAFVHCCQYPLASNADKNQAPGNAEYIAALSPAVVKELAQAYEILQRMVRADSAAERAHALMDARHLLGSEP